MSARPPVRGTATVLTAGTSVSAALFVVGLVLAAARLDDLARTAANLGVVALLLTPAVSLVVTAVELRPHAPRASLLALLVLGILAAATAASLLLR